VLELAKHTRLRRLANYSEREVVKFDYPDKLVYAVDPDNDQSDVETFTYETLILSTPSRPTYYELNGY